jgi:predicted TIM-barrel fold metal-dependent hydrolase
MSPVIDFRARPNTPEWARYLARRRMTMRSEAGGTRYGEYLAEEETLAAFVAQLDAAGITRAVFAARSRASSDPKWTLTNDFVGECVAAFPDRLVGFAGVDASDPAAAAEEARRAIGELGLLGVCFDPFALLAAPDDERFDVIYQACADLGVPVVVTLGGWPGIPAPLRLSSPLAIDAAAKRFPQLLFIASHAGWPFPQEMIAVAWRCENVYFENSFYHFAPGAEVLIDAANTMIGHKMLYASAYPFAPLDKTLDRFRELPLAADVAAQVLHGNADALLARIAKSARAGY